MRVWESRVREIHLNPGGLAAWIECPEEATPTPGQYLQCRLVEHNEEPLSHVVFPMEFEENRILTASPVPTSWNPGSRLLVRGPLGKGFQLPTAGNRLAAIALDESVERLYPLLKRALKTGWAVTVCSPPPFPYLPAEIEIIPLNMVEDIISWSDYLVMDIHLKQLDYVRSLLNRGTLPQGQALVYSPIPCAGLADCGICAFTNGKMTLFSCKDGPVFVLNQLSG